MERDELIDQLSGHMFDTEVGWSSIERRELEARVLRLIVDRLCPADDAAPALDVDAADQLGAAHLMRLMSIESPAKPAVDTLLAVALLDAVRCRSSRRQLSVVKKFLRQFPLESGGAGRFQLAEEMLRLADAEEESTTARGLESQNVALLREAALIPLSLCLSMNMEQGEPVPRHWPSVTAHAWEAWAAHTGRDHANDLAIELRLSVVANQDYVDAPWWPTAAARLGRRLYDRFVSTGDKERLDQALTVTHRAIERGVQVNSSCGEQNFDVGRACFDYGLMLSMLAEQVLPMDEEALREAATCFDMAVRTGLPDSMHLLARNNYLAALYKRSAMSMDRATAQESVAAADHLLEEIRDLPFDMLTGKIRIQAAGAHWVLAKLDNDMERLEHARSLATDGMSRIPPGSPHRDYDLAVQAQIELIRYQMQGDLAALARSTAGFKQAAAQATGSAIHSRLNSLARNLSAQFRATGDTEAFREAEETLRHALTLAPEGSSYRCFQLEELGDLLMTRFRVTEDASWLEAAITELETGTAPNRGGVRSHGIGIQVTLAEALLLRSESKQAYDSAATDRAIQLLRSVVSADDKAEAWALLGTALRFRGDHTDNQEETQEAINALRRALAMESESSAACWHNLAEALETRTDPDGVHHGEIISARRRAVEKAERNDPYRLHYQLDLAESLLSEYGRESAEETAELLEEILKSLTESESNCAPRRLAFLFARSGETAFANFFVSSHEESLDLAITAARNGLERAGTDNPHYPALLVVLSSALQQRFDLTGDMESLAEAIEVTVGGTNSLPDDSPARAHFYGNASCHLRISAELADHKPTLDAAVELGRVGYHAAQDPHLKATNAQTLAKALLDSHSWTRVDGLNESHLLVESQECLQGTLENLPENSIERVVHLLTLAQTFERKGDPAGRQKAARQALENSREGDRVRDQALVDLGMALSDAGHVGEAIPLFKEVAQNPLSNAYERVHAAARWGYLAKTSGASSQSFEALSLAVHQLPELRRRSVSRVSQERILAHWPTLVSDAAASALDCGESKAALELLEYGRGILIGDALDLRGDLSGLRGVDPQLAQEFEHLKAVLSRERPLPGVGVDNIPPEGPLPKKHPSSADIADARHRAEKRLRQVTERIRRLRGHERFLLPPGVDDVLPLAEEGPIAVINVSASRCDALLLASGRIEVLPLAEISADELEKKVRTFSDALERSLSDQSSALERRAAEAVIRDILAYLWYALAQPVAEALELRTTSGNLPRMWWCVTGLLNLLPLHAAGDFDQPYANMLDRAVCSYIPTLRTLRHVRQRRASIEGNPLVVAVPHAEGQRELTHADKEARGVAKKLGCTPLVGPDATVAAVWDALSRSHRAHFATHAEHVPEMPSYSSLVLFDGKISVHDLVHTNMDSSEIAVLSACSTAKGGDVLADEAVNIVGAFQLAGFRHVVGTLWPVPDVIALRMSERVHAALSLNTVAGEVHAAVRALQRESPRTPSAWASYVHVGP